MSSRTSDPARKTKTASNWRTAPRPPGHPGRQAVIPAVPGQRPPLTLAGGGRCDDAGTQGNRRRGPGHARGHSAGLPCVCRRAATGSRGPPRRRSGRRAMIPLGKTAFGVTVWPVLPGREAGQRTRLVHLTWGGAGDALHLHATAPPMAGDTTAPTPGQSAARAAPQPKHSKPQTLTSRGWARLPPRRTRAPHPPPQLSPGRPPRLPPRCPAAGPGDETAGYSPNTELRKSSLTTPCWKPPGAGATLTRPRGHSTGRTRARPGPRSGPDTATT